MGINKVEYGGTTLIDLTGDNVTPEALVVGFTAHGGNGEPVDGENPYEKTATDAEISTQTDLIAQIKTALDGKAAGGGSDNEVIELTLTPTGSTRTIGYVDAETQTVYNQTTVTTGLRIKPLVGMVTIYGGQVASATCDYYECYSRKGSYSYIFLSSGEVAFT